MQIDVGDRIAQLVLFPGTAPSPHPVHTGMCEGKALLFFFLIMFIYMYVFIFWYRVSFESGYYVAKAGFEPLFLPLPPKC